MNATLPSPRAAAPSANPLSSGSVVSYPVRGPWGSKSYHGNNDGQLFRDLIAHLQARGNRIQKVCDPMQGSGTMGDLCADLGLDYAGLDLKDGFNILRDSLRDTLKARQFGEPDYIQLDPPYNDMVLYSGNVWGQEAHPDDLSRCATLDEFYQKLHLAMLNSYDALRTGGHYSLIISDHRKQGDYHCYIADILGFNIGKLQNIVIKQQNNYRSGGKSYSGKPFCPITHQYMAVWSKDPKVASIGNLMFQQSLKQSRQWWGTWKNTLTIAMRQLGGRATIAQVNDWVFGNVELTGRSKEVVAAKIRQTLQYHFERQGRGLYAAAA